MKIDKNKQTIEAYDKNPKHYSKMFDSYDVRTEDIDRAIKLNKSGSNNTIELGCGNGRDARYMVFRLSPVNYRGIDASEGLVKLARENVPQGEFYVKDIRKLSFEPETFGIIFSFATLLHVKQEELSEIIKKCQKWLKNGGILYISTKYGEYKELLIENLGDQKYYYSYLPEDIIKMAGTGFETVYSIIHDSDYGPELVMALKKIGGSPETNNLANL